jgi:large subunit ribosomal protein L4
LVVIEDLASKEGKTSELAKLLSKIGANRRTLIAVEHKTPELVRACQNLTDTKIVQAKYLNVYDIINADTIVLTAAALATITTWLDGGTK